VKIELVSYYKSPVIFIFYAVLEKPEGIVSFAFESPGDDGMLLQVASFGRSLVATLLLWSCYYLLHKHHHLQSSESSCKI